MKIVLLVIFVLTIIVVWLMFGNSRPTVESPESIQIPASGNVEQNVENMQGSPDKTNTFEEDVIKDLEGFFENNNGYEDVQGEFGFTSPENE